MRTFILKDEEINLVLGYFIWFEKENEYYIELVENTDEWDMPFILDHFARKKQWTIDNYYTDLFIRQRIVPLNRQNIGMILKENGLEEYDEIKLLILADGRCAQDECSLQETEKLPDEIIERMTHRIVSVSDLDDMEYRIDFANGKSGILSIAEQEAEEEWKEFCRLYRHYREVFYEKNGFALRYEGHPGITYDRVYNAVMPV